MAFSFTSFFTVIFLSNILIVLLWVVLKSNRLIRQIGIKPLICCLAVIMFRLLIPTEFSFTNTVTLRGAYTKIIFSLGSL